MIQGRIPLAEGFEEIEALIRREAVERVNRSHDLMSARL